MSSSSSPEGPEGHKQDGARLSLGEVEEAEAILNQNLPKAERLSRARCPT